LGRVSRPRYTEESGRIYLRFLAGNCPFSSHDALIHMAPLDRARLLAMCVTGDPAVEKAAAWHLPEIQMHEVWSDRDPVQDKDSFECPEKCRRR
jgi:hypothetical protein